MELSIADVRTIMVGWRDALSAAISALDPLLGEPMPAALVAPPAPRDKTGAMPKERPVAKRRSEPVSDFGSAILTALRQQSPQSPGALARALNLTLPRLRHHLKPLQHNGAITVKGTTAARRISLASGKPAKEAP